MTKIKMFSAVLLAWLCVMQTANAFCLGPVPNPFEQAQDVYLAEVVAVHPTKENNSATSAQIKVIRVYKSHNIETVKQLNTLSAYRGRWGFVPEPFALGAQYLLYDHPTITACQQFNNGIVSPDKIKLFEKEHAPIWVAP